MDSDHPRISLRRPRIQALHNEDRTHKPWMTCTELAGDKYNLCVHISRYSHIPMVALQM